MNRLRIGVVVFGTNFQYRIGLQRRNGLGDAHRFIGKNFQHGAINKDSQRQLPLALAKVSGALASNICNSKPLKLITTWTSLFPLLIPKRTPLADYKSISASISSVFVAGSGNALRSPSICTFRQATRSPRSLFNCGAGFCRS